MKTKIIIAIAVLTGVASLTHAAILNPGFESGPANWLETPVLGNFTTPTSVPGLLPVGPLQPPQGNRFAVISNFDVNQQSIAQTFTLGAGDNYLSFDYRLWTDAWNDLYNDTATAVLTPQFGSPITLLTVSRDDLQPGGVGPVAAGADYLVGGLAIGHANWQSFSANVSAFIGQTVTLSFVVDQGGDGDNLFETRLGIDNVQLSAVPEPSAPALVGLGLAALVGVQRVRRVKSAVAN